MSHQAYKFFAIGFGVERDKEMEGERKRKRGEKRERKKPIKGNSCWFRWWTGFRWTKKIYKEI